MYIIHIDLRHLTPIVVLFSGNTGTKWESFGWSCSSRSDGGWCRQWLRACGSVLQEIVHSCCHFASVCVRSGVVLVMRRTDSRGTAQRRTAYCLKWILSPEESFRWLFLHVWSKSAVQQLQTGLFRSSFNKNSRFSSDRCGLHSKRSLLSKAQERVKTQSHINELQDWQVWEGTSEGSRPSVRTRSEAAAPRWRDWAGPEAEGVWGCWLVWAGQEQMNTLFYSSFILNGNIK